MAQKIKIRRGGIDNIGSTIAVSKGELLYASGSTNGVEHVVFISNADGNNTFTPINKLYQGTSAATSFSSQLNGIPYHNTSDKAIYILNNSSSPVLDLTGNIAGKTVSGALTITGNLSLNSNISASGNVTASNILATGDIRALGNIYIGDSTSDNVIFGADISSSLIPNDNNSFDLGSNSQQWKTLYAVDGKFTRASGSFSGSFVGNGSSLTNLTSANMANIFTIAGDSGTDSIGGSETVTFTGGDGITTSAATNAVTIYVDSTVIRTTGDQSIAGNKTFTSPVTASIVSSSTSVITGTLTSTTSNLGTLGSAINANNVAITNVNIDSGDIASDVVINKSPVITLGGDLIGNVTLTNLASGTLTATIAANSVALGTDTTGDYVSTITAGAGLTGTSTGESSTPTLAVGQGSHITVNADDVAVNTSTLIPAISGSILTTVSGDVTITALGVATIAANSVALGTDTTGDYVASLGSLTGLSTTGNSGEGSTPTLSVSYGSSANTAVQGNTNITINGTSNEIEVTGTAAQALGAAPSYTIGLPDNVNIASNLTVAGNLTVSGTTTTVNSTTVNIGDNIIILNAASAVADGGIQVIDATSTAHTGSLLWNATGDYWYAGISGSTHYRISELASGTPISNNLITKVNSAGRLVASSFTDDGSSISTSLGLSAASFTATSLTANTFLKSDASKGISSVAVTDTTNVPDVYFAYSSANGFFATSIIDGGSF